AVLPCYWIYWEVGRELERAGSPDPLYTRWIGTYASDEFGDVVRAVIDATNRVAVRLSAAERHAMIRHFVTTSRYEWMLWEMGYGREAWPLGGDGAVMRDPDVLKRATALWREGFGAWLQGRL